jgi:hypothetical protein
VAVNPLCNDLAKNSRRFMLASSEKTPIWPIGNNGRPMKISHPAFPNH